ncbi:hypothetical protein SAMN05428988_3256 [Chitinophaga sp. YR573]|uniref:hypothetical protein n=1 Tax=Chitinophaga sp. YR573 TaxID=1881040 RepID=UPI0008B6B9C1|nr:hypothetical protein [Chitinophaga sp. YR573]SEW21844.1 hypothetical protein SAMN05428988_3256 [Chitinophaga sp. YR573]
MSIVGPTREPRASSGFRVGLGVLEPLIVNPTKKEIKEILGWESEKDPEYVINDNGVKSLKLEIWVKDLSTGKKHKIQIRLKDQIATSEKGKKRYIDKKGTSTFWVENTDNFQSWFKENNPWVARSGEVELYKFLRAHTGELREKSPEVSRVLDWKKLMKGDVSEINEIRGQSFSTNIVGLYAVRLAKVGDEFKEFQTIYNREFLSVSNFGYYKSTIPITEIKDRKLAFFLSQILHPEHGCKDFFGANRVLELAHDYDPAQNKLLSDSPIITDDNIPTPDGDNVEDDPMGAFPDMDDDLDLMDSDY